MAHEQRRPKPAAAKDDKKPPLAFEDQAASAAEHQAAESDRPATMPRTGYAPPNLLALQRTVGNQTVQRMLNPAAQRAPTDAKVQRAPVLDGLGQRATAGLRILLADIDSDMAPAEQLTQLVRNFKKVNFTYTMQFKQNFQPLINDGALSEGDCATLSNAMVHIATEYLNIKGMGKEKVGGLYVGSSNRTIDGSKRPNVDRGTAWVFESHTWVTGPGGAYDPLFGDVLSKAGWKEHTKTERIPGTALDKDTYGDVVLVGPVMKPDFSKEYLTYDEALKFREIDKQNAALFLGPEKPQKSRGLCYITTACTEARGLPDDCDELVTLRHFRDTYMQTLPNGPALIEEYYEKSPPLVAAIKRRPDAMRIFDLIYGQIVQTVKMIKAGELRRAFERYCEIVLDLNRQYGQ